MIYGQPPYSYKNYFSPNDQDLIDSIKAANAPLDVPGIFVSEETKILL
jgi:hypothetical protein